MYPILRLTANRVFPSISRSFLTASIARKDLIQDLYISQLKSYKPALQTKDAHVGAVRNFAAPTPPSPPSLPTDLAAELSKFDAEEPSIGGSSSQGVAAKKDEAGGQSAEEFLAFLEQDLPKPDEHHH